MKAWRRSSIEVEPPWADWVKLDARSLLPLLVNDLEAPAFDLDPDLGRLRQRTEELIGRTVRMSGSGSSLFSLYDADEREAARAAVDAIEREGCAKALVTDVGVNPDDDLARVPSTGRVLLG